MRKKAKPNASRKTARGAKKGRWISEAEFGQLRDHLREATETLDAIRGGEVDALVVSGPRGEQIYSLSGADEPYRIYVERMQEGAVTISSAGVILYANQRFADMVLRPLEQVIGSNACRYLNGMSWRELYSVFRSHSEVVKCETALPRMGERPLPVSLSASHLPIKGQNVMCLVVTDLSAQRQSEDLRLAKEVAERANQAKDTFLAALSHELRTPLNPVLMMASEAAANSELPARVRADFAFICRNIELEARLIDDLLDLSRITHGKLALSTNLVDGHAVLRNAIANVKSDVDAKRLSLTTSLDRKPCPIKADAVRLQQVFWNVLKNAIKFTPQNGQIKISTRVIPEKGRMLVSIADTGMGMTKEEMQLVFEAFAQGDHAKIHGVHLFGGLGLGLSISKMIVKMHSGEIRAHSDGRGKGSTFTIELPLVRSARDDDFAADADTPARNRLYSAERLNILLVEDHEPTRAALARLLINRHHTVVIAATAGEARALAEKTRLDLVISDIGLPDDSGFDLMNDLNQRHNLKGIALTGYGSEEDVTSSKRSGFVSHLTKPIRMESLEVALATAVSEIRSSQLV